MSCRIYCWILLDLLLLDKLQPIFPLLPCHKRVTGAQQVVKNIMNIISYRHFPCGSCAPLLYLFLASRALYLPVTFCQTLAAPCLCILPPLAAPQIQQVAKCIFMLYQNGRMAALVQYLNGSNFRLQVQYFKTKKPYLK